jgi:hypothetical protein
MRRFARILFRISEQTTADVVRQLEALEFLPGDYIVREGDEGVIVVHAILVSSAYLRTTLPLSGRDMMLISNGVVQVLNTRSTRATVYLSEVWFAGIPNRAELG